MQQLTDKQRAFVQAFVRSGSNASAAARAAFNVSKRDASKLGWAERHKPHVAQAIIEETQRFLSTATPKAIAALIGIVERDDLPPQAIISAADKIIKYAPQFGAVITHNDPAAEKFAEGLSKLAEIQAAAEARHEAERLDDQRNGNSAQVIEHIPKPGAKPAKLQPGALVSSGSSKQEREAVADIDEEEKLANMPNKQRNKHVQSLRSFKGA